MNHSITTQIFAFFPFSFFFFSLSGLTFAMVQPLTYDDINSKIKKRILSISPSHTISILAL